MYVYMILMISKEESNKAHFVSRLIQDCFNKQSLDSRFLQDQVLSHNKRFQVIQGTCNRLYIICNRLLETLNVGNSNFK